MRYTVSVNRKYQWIKVCSITKRINESTNPFSRAAASLVDRFILKKKKARPA